MRVLLIEDSPLASWQMQDAINRKTTDIEIICTETIRDSVNQVDNCDLILLDLSLPDATPEKSLEFAVRQEKPVVIYSGTVERQLVRKCAATGALAFVCKGTVIEQLLTGIWFAEALHDQNERRRTERNLKIHQLCEEFEKLRSR